jgi:hypothetical protein
LFAASTLEIDVRRRKPLYRAIGPSYRDALNLFGVEAEILIGGEGIIVKAFETPRVRGFKLG